MKKVEGCVYVGHLVAGDTVSHRNKSKTITKVSRSTTTNDVMIQAKYREDHLTVYSYFTMEDGDKLWVMETNSMVQRAVCGQHNQKDCPYDPT